MMILFIAELALTVAFKFSTWCLGKTFDGIMYIVKRQNNDNKDNNDNDDFVVISHQEYCSLKKTHELYLNYASSSSCSSSSSSSSSCSSDAEDASSTSK